MRAPRRVFPLLALLGLLAATAAEPGAAPRRPALPVKIVQNLAYYEARDADPVQHRLDLYLPTDRTGFPVVFYVHGGAWTIGHKNQLGIPARLGKLLAQNGIGMVSINYRLSPWVKHPEHIRDVARAFAWTHRHIARYGGRPDEIFVSGHSAGGHLVALLATDAEYLKAEGLDLGAIRGAIPISGVFRLDPPAYFATAFGRDPAVLRQASPITYAGPHVPPFLILYADSDLPACDRPAAQAFYRALRSAGAPVQIREIKDRNHVTILWRATRETDPAYRALTNFILAHTVLHRLAAGEAGALDLLQEFATAPARP